MVRTKEITKERQREGINETVTRPLTLFCGVPHPRLPALPPPGFLPHLCLQDFPLGLPLAAHLEQWLPRRRPASTTSTERWVDSLCTILTVGRID